jgi:hypothetical protein
MTLPLTYLYAVHGEHNTLDYTGWSVLTRGIGANPDDRNGENFRQFRHTKIVRLNHGYHPHGTIPRPDKYTDFAWRVRNFVEMSPGCSRWIIGNEPNLEIERPDGQTITPAMYAECYTQCRDAIHSLQFHSGDQVLVAAIGPWNIDTQYPGNPSGDWIRYFEDVQHEIGAGGLDGFAIHAYVREQTPQSVTSSARMDPPFEHYHSGFRVYMDWMAAILNRFQGLPAYLTEFCIAGEPWQDINTGCVQAVYAEINAWNRMRPERPISCAAIYRWQYDQWAIADKPRVQDDFHTAVERGYTVPADAEPEPPEPPEEDDMQNPSLELPYRQADPDHSTVIVAHGWEYWASDGKPPERDGPAQLPEYKPLTRQEDPRRVYDGDTAQCWFIRWKIMDAGIYQRVPAEMGALYSFDAMFQAWCSNSDDPTVSDGDMHVMLGIDPHGGMDAFSQEVIWSDWKRADAEYRQYTSPQIAALDDHITLFVRAWNKWELSHNDIYVDDCHLIAYGGTPPGGGEPVDYDRIEEIVRRVVAEREPVAWPRQPNA